MHAAENDTARDTTTDTTRERILAAASEEFVEHGFDKATVRDICGRAEANVAAVNYHFRDKRNLYRHVLIDWAQGMMRRYPVDLGLEPDMDGPGRLRAFIHAELLRLLPDFSDDPHKSLRQARIILAEMTSGRPDPELIDILHTPVKASLDALLADLLGPKATPAAVDQCANCVMGQCIYYMLIKLGGVDETIRLETQEDVRALSHQLTTFSLGGIRAVKETLR